MSYITHLEITDTLSEDEVANRYLKRVDVVEMFDQDGNPWQPYPDLAVETNSRWRSGNYYFVNYEVGAYVAGFTGGNEENSTYRYRFQYRESSEDPWTSTAWTNYDNVVREVRWTVPPEASAGQIRFQSQARDTTVSPEIQANSFASIQPIPEVIPEIVATFNGALAPTDPGAYIEIMPGGDRTATLYATLPGFTGPPVTWYWSRTQGVADLSDRGDGLALVTFTHAGTLRIRVDASDGYQQSSYEYYFYVN